MDRRILVVDDSELICQQLSQLLASPDRRIKVAHDGTTALEWIVERNFSLVLTDLCLPGINGLDLIREIRQRDLPVTAITRSPGLIPTFFAGEPSNTPPTSSPRVRATTVSPTPENWPLVDSRKSLFSRGVK